MSATPDPTSTAAAITITAPSVVDNSSSPATSAVSAVAASAAIVAATAASDSNHNAYPTTGKEAQSSPTPSGGVTAASANSSNTMTNNNNNKPRASLDNNADSVATTRLFVYNMHYSVSEGDIIKIFQGFGTVRSVEYHWHKSGPERGKPKGSATVEMGSIKEAQMALESCTKRALLVKGRKLNVNYSHGGFMYRNAAGAGTGISAGSNAGGAANVNNRKRMREEDLVQGMNSSCSNSSSGIGGSGGSSNVDDQLRRLQATLRAMEAEKKKK